MLENSMIKKISAQVQHPAKGRQGLSLYPAGHDAGLSALYGRFAACGGRARGISARTWAERPPSAPSTRSARRCISRPARASFPRDIGKDRPCLNQHLGRLLRALHGKVSAEEYRRADLTGGVHLRGRREAARARADREVNEAAEELQFERAARPSRPSARHPEARHAAACGRRGVRRAGRDRVRTGTDPGVRVRAALRRRLAAKQGIHPVPPDRGRPAEVLSAFVKQYYAQRGAAPKTVLLSHEIEDADAAGGVPVLARRTKGRACRTAERANGAC